MRLAPVSSFTSVSVKYAQLCASDDEISTTRFDVRPVEREGLALDAGRGHHARVELPRRVEDQPLLGEQQEGELDQRRDGEEAEQQVADAPGARRVRRGLGGADAHALGRRAGQPERRPHRVALQVLADRPRRLLAGALAREDRPAAARSRRPSRVSPTRTCQGNSPTTCAIVAVAVWKWW